MTGPAASLPCPAYADACQAAAWGLGDDPQFAAHREGCERCRAALAEAQAFAARVEAAAAPPPAAGGGLARDVFARTTRGKPELRRRSLVWAGLGAGVAAAGATFLALRRPAVPAAGDALDLAEADPELLRHLELAEDLELLEVLDALEALDHV